MPTIPKWVPPLAGRGDLNKQSSVNETTKTILAEGSPAPIILGQAQVGGKIFAADYDSGVSPGVWTVGVLWAVGENESIVETYADGAVFAGVTQNDYAGSTAQTADGLLAAAISGYSDTLVLDRNGTDVPFCYTVFQWNDSHYKSLPDFVAEIKGLKTNGGVYSDSPTRAVEYLIEDPVLGPGETADSTTFSSVATDNAATVVSESRRLIGLVVDKTQRFDDWLKVAAAYMSAWITKRGSTYFAVSDRPASQVAALTTDDWREKSFSLQIPDRDDQPSVVEVVFTDTNSVIWRDRVARAEVTGVSAGSVPERVSRVRMPGVTRYSQAVREAEERRDKLYNGGMTVSFDAFDDQIVRELGDIIDVTRGTHLTNVDFRIVAPPVKKLGGGVTIQAAEYISTAYSDSEPSDPSYVDPAQVLGAGNTATTNTGALADADTVDLSSTGSGGVSNTLPALSGGTGLTSTSTLQNANVNYASDGTGTLPAASGGTGLTSTSTLQNANVNYASDGTGTLPEASGGTGLTSIATLQNSEIRPYGAVTFASSTQNFVYTDAVEKCGKIYSASDTTSGAAFPAFPVSLDSTDGALEISIALKTSLTSGSRSNGLYIRVSEYDAALPEGATHVVSNAADAHADCISHDRLGSISPTHENRSSTAGWTVYTTTYTPTSSAQFASLVLFNWSNLGSGTETLWFKEPIIRPVVNIDVTMVADVVQTRFTSADGGSTYHPTATTQVVNIQAISSGSETCTVTWTRSGVNVDSAVLSGSGFTMSAFGVAGVAKTVTVTHTASSAAIAVSCEVVETDLTGGSGK